MNSLFETIIKESDECMKKYLNLRIKTFSSHFTRHYGGCMSLVEYIFLENLGNNLSKIHVSNLIDVIDVGAFPCLNASIMIGNNTNFTYTSIDDTLSEKNITHAISNLTKTNITSWKKVTKKCYESFDVVKFRKYDILLIDIEPHGDECNIYNYYKPCLKSYHLVLISCVGCIGIVGSYFGNKFIEVNKNYIECIIFSPTPEFRFLFLSMSINTTSTINYYTPFLKIDKWGKEMMVSFDNKT